MRRAPTRRPRPCTRRSTVWRAAATVRKRARALARGASREREAGEHPDTRSNAMPLRPHSRLATAVPPRRYHTVKYAGVLAAASHWRSRIARAFPDAIGSTDKEQGREPKRRGGYRP